MTTTIAVDHFNQLSLNGLREVCDDVHITYERDLVSEGARTTSSMANIRKNNLSQYISATGGMARAEIVFNGQKFSGFAKCSENDTFSRKIGRQIAIGRAIKKLQAVYGLRVSA